MTSYITTEKLNEIPALQGADGQTRALALENAGRVQKYVDQHPWIDETDLRKYGERNGIGPDAMNTALAVLRHAGTLHVIDAAPPPSPAQPEKPAKSAKPRKARSKRATR